MKTKLKVDHRLFEKLAKNPPLWWKNLIADSDLYIDIRKDNYINVYHNGGSIMKLEGAEGYKAKIHFEYIPLEREKNYLSFKFNNDAVTLEKHETISISNFGKGAVDKIKKRIRKFYPDNSEKGIQGKYVVKNNNLKKSIGFFIDTEFQYDNKRVDMVWVDLEKKKIVLVELKTVGDERLDIEKGQSQETIDKQLKKYYDFARNNKKDLVQYYAKIYFIRKELGILPEFVKEESMEDFELIEKPILLVGDCTQKWIDKNATDLNKYLSNIAFGCIYHGRNTFNFQIPYKTSRNCYRLDGK